MLSNVAGLRRLVLVAVAVGSTVLGGLALASAPALAATGFTFAFSFDGPSGHTFENPVGLAVDNSAGASKGDVYVADQGHNVIDKFSPAGTFIASVELAGAQPNQLTVDDNAGANEGYVYVAGFGSGSIYRLTPGLTSPEEVLTRVSGPTGVAVDAANDFFVSLVNSGTVVEYNDKWEPVNPEGTVVLAGENTVVAGLNGPQTLAVSPAGDIFVATSVGTIEYKLSGDTYKEEPALDGVSSNGVTVAPSGEVFVSQGNEIVEYEPSTGTQLSVFGSGVLADVYGVGVSGESGDVYASDLGNDLVQVFAPGSVTPEQSLTVKVEPAAGGVVACEDKTVSPGVKEACKVKYPEGDEIVLTQTANTGYEFKEYGGECSGTGACEVTLSQAREVKAIYAKIPLPTHLLKVEVEGEGEVTGGTIACTTGGVGTCSEAVEETNPVALTAKAAAGSKFEGWSLTGTTCTGASTVSPCDFTMPGAEVTVKAKFGVITTSPLTVFVTGQGKVSSEGANPLIDCGPEGECEAEFEGPVTLTATAEQGSVFAGWVGCKKASTNTCTIDVAAPSEVTAVFLAKGEKGTSGTNGTNGSPGAQGPAGTNGANGEIGASGANGANGATGAQGPAGPAGPAGAAGPAGPAGKQGPAGKVQVVTCTKQGKKKKCTTKTVSGTAKFTTSSARATLSRHGVVFAAGTASISHGHQSLRLTTQHTLQAGHYTLTVISGKGKHETIHNEALTLS